MKWYLSLAGRRTRWRQKCDRSRLASKTSGAILAAFLWTSLVASAEPVVAAKRNAFAERLLVTCSENAGNYHRLLHDTSHEVRRVALHRKWSDVEVLMRKAGFPQINTWTVQGLIYYQYLVTKDGWQGADQSRHSLVLEFTVDDRKKDTASPTKPGTVITAHSALWAEPNRPYAKVLASGAYAKDSIVSQGLRLPEVAATAKKYPILKKIEVAYDFLEDRWLPTVSQGFDFTFTFGDSARDGHRGKELYFTATSGLDAPQDWKGKRVPQPFTPRDSIGEMRPRGSNEWK